VQGNVYGLTVFVSDITELINAEQKLHNAIIEKEVLEEREILLNSIGEGLYGVDLQGKCFFINPAALKKLGYQHQEDLLGKTIHELIHHHYPDNTSFPIEMCITCKTIKNNEQYRQRDWFIRKNGEFFPVNLISTPIIKHTKIIGTIVAFSDISQQYSDEQKLKTMNDLLYMQSITDPLTQLYNRRFLQEDGTRLFKCYAQDEQQFFSVLVFDIDHFKQINDTFGHDIGDKVLIMLANTIKAELRSDEIFARTGGEEFAVLLPRIDSTAATRIAQRIQQAIRSAKITEAGQDISCTISIGIAQTEQALSDFSSLLTSADKKLYLAKGNGRDRIEY
jgi:diguanylate cyclase (GGDEF)-like protein/PAS domain S-box-containing protein